MLRGLRSFLSLLVVAALICGNGVLGISAANGVAGHAQSVADTGHGHGHDVAVGEHADADSGSCEGSGCDGNGDAHHPCCQMHAHCCTSLFDLPSDLKLAALSPRVIDAALFEPAMTLGTIVYPLLRPPRLAA